MSYALPLAKSLKRHGGPTKSGELAKTAKRRTCGAFGGLGHLGWTLRNSIRLSSFARRSRKTTLR